MCAKCVSDQYTIILPKSYIIVLSTPYLCTIWLIRINRWHVCYYMNNSVCSMMAKEQHHVVINVLFFWVDIGEIEDDFNCPLASHNRNLFLEWGFHYGVNFVSHCQGLFNTKNPNFFDSYCKSLCSQKKNVRKTQLQQLQSQSYTTQQSCDKALPSQIIFLPLFCPTWGMGELTAPISIKPKHTSLRGWMDYHETEVNWQIKKSLSLRRVHPCYTRVSIVGIPMILFSIDEG